MWRGRRIVSADSVRASTAPQLTEEQAASEGQYGYQWRVDNNPEMPNYYAAGAWCQGVLVYPSRRVVAVITADDSAGYDANRVFNVDLHLRNPQRLAYCRRQGRLARP